MLKLLEFINTPPKSNYQSYYNIAKYELTWKILSYVGIGVTIISLGYLFFDFSGFYASLYGAITANLIWYWFYKVRNFYIVGIVYTIHSILFLGAIMFLLEDALHVIEYVWFVMFTLFGFFVLGKKVGYLALIFSALLIAIYLFFFLNKNINTINNQISNYNLIATFFNIAVAFYIIGTIISKFKTSIQYAQNKNLEINNELQERNNLIKAQNDEKSIMLKEIHHRVKNNLQVVSSIIRLQSFEISDESAKKIFNATIGRVIAMALIHEKMYQNDNLSKIDLTEYLNSLANDIMSSVELNKKINFNIKSNLSVLGNRTIVPLALIFNELITNSIKYAFENIENPAIKIDVRLFDENYFIMSYTDNGLWKNSIQKGFGLELIETFVEQLDGEFNRKSDLNGTQYKFKLKNIE